MIFSRTTNIDLPWPLIIEKTAIERKSGTRFLSVIIDESLNWTVKCRNIKKISASHSMSPNLPQLCSITSKSLFACQGFTCKYNIQALFSKKKKGLRAIIPGFINYRYREGETAGHTKSAFSDYNVLTVHQSRRFS